MAATQTILDEAEAAYHLLMTGRGVAKFRDQNGEEVTYTTANKNALATYIVELKRQLGITVDTGPMRAWF